jgi:hypothetical protein
LPESNGIKERANLTLANICPPALVDLPPSLWAESFNWATYLKNRLTHSALDGKTPYEVSYKKRPTISDLRPFVTHCYIHIAEKKPAAGIQLDPRSGERQLFRYTRLLSRFWIYIPSRHTVGAYRQVKFAPSSNDSTVSLDVNVPLELTVQAEELVPISSPPSRTSTPPPKQIEPITPASNSIKQEIQSAMPGAFGNDSPAARTLTHSESLEITLDAL